MGDIVIGRSSGSAGASFNTTVEIRDGTHDGPGQQPEPRPVSLEAVVWASPVFVVGCPRSGTTLAQTMLDSHPHLSVLYEANFLVDIPLGLRSSLVNASEALTLAEAHPNFRADSFDVRTARAVCRELGITDAAGAMRVLAASRALAQGKRRLGIKTPKGLLHLGELATVYPDAQFIHVIRDGRDSASSQTRVSGRSVVQGALLWRTGMRTGRRAGPRLGPDRYLEIRLEELLSSPEEQLRRMCVFLGEDFDQSLLHFYTAARERIPPSDLSIHPQLGKPPQPLPPSRESVATGLVQRIVTALIGAELVELGYISPASPGSRRRIVYVLIGYAFFLVSLRRGLRDLFRHFARSVGARRAVRSVTRQSSATNLRRHLAATNSHARPCQSVGGAMTRASVTVVVPTKNAARTLLACLESIASQSVRCGLVVVDCGSADDSKAIASGFADLLLDAAPNPSLQRNVGARALPADIIGFVDADMVVGGHVVEQVIEQIAAGSGSVVVPERSFGETYWAKVRTFERSMYLGALESPRFFSHDLFAAVGGFDEDLIAMEDTDLGLRASTRASVGRTSDMVLHDEGPLTYLAACRKKANYATGVAAFRRKHGSRALASHIRRPYFEHPSSLLAQPALGLGVLALKGGEAAAVAGRLLFDKASRPERRVAADQIRLK